MTKVLRKGLRFWVLTAIDLAILRVVHRAIDALRGA